MNNTYIIPAFELNEVKAACHCAKSISRTNPDCEIILMTDERFDDVNYNIFTQVESTPFAYVSSRSSQEHWWQAYYVTESTSNILLSPYTIINEDQTDLWDYLNLNYDLCVPSGYYNFRDEIVHKGKKWYAENDIPLVNSDAVFFKKDTDNALLFFKLFDIFTQNYEEALPNLIDLSKIPEQYDVTLIIPLVCKYMPNIIIDDGRWCYTYVERRTTDMISNYDNLYEVNNYRMSGAIVYDSYDIIREFIGDVK